MKELDKAFHIVALAIENIHWRDFLEVGLDEPYYDYYYAEDELYIIRDRVSLRLWFCKARSPKEAWQKYREELIVYNNLRESRLENEKLKLENEKLKKELQEARFAVEHNRHVAEENQLKYELHYRDGVIYGMKYALKCNGISGGEMEKRYE